MHLLLRDTIEMLFTLEEQLITDNSRRSIKLVIKSVRCHSLKLLRMLNDLTNAIPAHKIDSIGHTYRRRIDIPHPLKRLFHKVRFAGFGLIF